MKVIFRPQAVEDIVESPNEMTTRLALSSLV
jgi:hypothetical protein